MFWCLKLGCYSSASFEISSEVRAFICYILLLIAAYILRSVATNTAWPIAVARHTMLCTFNFCLIEVPVSIKICMISLNPALTGRSAIWHFKHSEVIEIRSGIIFWFLHETVTYIVSVRFLHGFEFWMSVFIESEIFTTIWIVRTYICWRTCYCGLL